MTKTQSYVVGPSDTLYTIATRHRTTAAELWQMNMVRLSEVARRRGLQPVPYVIFPGTIIDVPALQPLTHEEREQRSMIAMVAMHGLLVHGGERSWGDLATASFNVADAMMRAAEE